MKFTDWLQSSFSNFDLFTFIGRIVLVIIFTLAVAGKIIKPDQYSLFIESLLNANLIISKFIVGLTIIFEATIALGIVLYSQNKWPYFLSGGFMLLFSGFITFALFINLDIPCGCFGSFIKEYPMDSYSLLRSITIAALSFILPFKNN